MHPTCALREQLYSYGEDEVAGEVRGAPEAPLQPDHTTLQPCSPAALQPCSPHELNPPTRVMRIYSVTTSWFAPPSSSASDTHHASRPLSTALRAHYAGRTLSS